VFDSILKTLPNASARRLEEGLVRVCYTTAVQIHWYLGRRQVPWIVRERQSQEEQFSVWRVFWGFQSLRTGIVLRDRGVALHGVALSQDSVADERTRSLPTPLPALFPFSPRRAHTQHMYNSTPRMNLQDCSAQVRTRETNPAPTPLFRY
jgi:hypothetical protein